ncbi:MAG: hypothetical protein HKN57_07065 [Xanthomonadales bacterium]|jgi:hypothetical protein|nr:hypothetical protein [Xanthomonadales bacterium]
MKRIIIASLLSVAASAAFAHDDALSGIDEWYGSVLLDHRAGSTGEPLKGESELYGSFFANPELLEADRSAQVIPWDPAEDWKAQIN